MAGRTNVHDLPTERDSHAAAEVLAAIFELAVQAEGWLIETGPFNAKTEEHRLKLEENWALYENDADGRNRTRACMIRAARVAVASACGEEPKPRQIELRHLEDAERAIHNLLFRAGRMQSGTDGPYKALGFAC